MKRALKNLLIILILLNGYSAWAQPEPTNHATGFSVTAISTTQIDIDWTDATGATVPEFYLIVGRELPGGTFASVADGAEVPADADWTDGNFAAIVAHGGASSLSVTVLDPGTGYEFAIYSYTENAGNANYKTGGQPTASDYTFSAEPSGHSTTFTATLNGNVDIDLAFDAANTLTNADGYLIYRRSGSAASLTGLNDGAAPPSPLGGSTTLIYTTTNSETTYSDTGLQGGVTYHYVLVPFNYDGANNGTYNYLTNGSEPRTNATTNLIISIVEITGGGIAVSPLNTGSSDLAILGFSITTNGPTTFNALNVAVTSTPVGKFTSPRIFKSANATYGGDASINSGSLSATQLQFASVGDVLTAGTTNYFIVVNVAGSASGSIQPSFTQANATFTSPSGTAQTVTITGDTYTFVDASPPAISSSIPTDGATGVSVLLTTFTINFDEPVAFVGDNLDDANRIRIWDDDANAFVETIELIDVNVAGSVVTFTTNFAFVPSTDYDVVIGNSVFEDITGNDFAGITEDNWEFQIEAIPNISGFSNGGTRCIGDVLTINGSGFTGTGGIGNTKPFVTMEGVSVPPANITAFTNASITLTIPAGVATGSNTTVIVVNQDNLLSSDGSDDLTNLHDPIITGLAVIPETLNPAQNTNVDVDVQSTQPSNYEYVLILTSGPVGYSTPPKEVHRLAGNAGTITLNTSDGADPDLTAIGDYQFRIDVERSGCTTRTLSNTPFTLTVADLSVSASATNTTICAGVSTTLIGAASGGTGFYQFKWTSNPAGFSSGSSSPTVSPTANITYLLEVTDNQGNTDQSSVVITVNASITADIVPTFPNTEVITIYTFENRDYELTGNPVGAGGVFSGNGIIFKNTKYFFNPSVAGIGTYTITYTYTNAQGCSASDTESFEVRSSSIDGLDLSYCQATATDGPLAPNSNFPAAYQFTRLILYVNDNVNNTYCIGDIADFPFCGKPNPLTVNGYQIVPDIRANGIILPLGTTFLQPVSYTLNLNVLRDNYGYSDEKKEFAILAYGRDASGIERWRAYQFFQVLRNETSPTIVGIKEGEATCSDLSSITLTSSEAAYAVSNFSISPIAFNPSINSGTGVFDPDHASLAGADSRKLTAMMAYTDKNNCPNSVSTNFVWVKKPSPPIANDTTFCAFTGIGTKPAYSMKANANGEADQFLWYEIDPVANPSALVLGNGELFQPKNIDGLTAITDQFYVVQSNFGCIGDFNEVSIEIKGAPTAIFTNSNICEDRDFTLTGPKDGATAYPVYEWYFGDTNFEIVSNDNLNTYNYGPGSANKPYTVSLIVTNSGGCQNEFSKTIIVGENPKPSFSLNYICDGDNTAFTATSVPASSEYSWDFGDGTILTRNTAGTNAPEGGTFQNPIHEFTSGPGDYSVTVTSYTASGCNNLSTRTISILHYLTRDTDNPYQMASEETGKGYWRLEDISSSGNSTWEFAKPTTPAMQEFTSAAWVTNADGFYAQNEKSFLNSPCLNIVNIERPILSMDLIFDTDKNIEGAVLEYSKDNGITWVSLGAENSGLNWFNTTGFRIGNIGNSPVGWSGKSSDDLNDNPEKEVLVQARRALDNLPNLTQAERSKVRFRIAFATTVDAKDGFEGIGFNNLSISTRDRISLLEMFTNVNASNYTPNNNVFKAIAIDEIAKIQYHVTYPDDDANASANKIDPAARAAYYGIPMSDQYIPRSYVDGHSEGTLIDGNWAITEFNKQSLQNSQYSIKIDSMQADDNSYLKIKVAVEAKVDIPTARNHVLHIAVVEKVVGSNEYVMRKLVPDVNGHGLPAMNQTETEVVIDSVQLEKSFVNVNNLAIVAFVQDLNSREIFQAAIELNPGYLPTLITGIESIGTELVSVYPNPASKQFRVELPAKVTSDVNVQLVDQVGRKHDGGFIPAGSNAASVNVEHLSEGIYILEIISSDNIIRKKVMVVMKN